MITDLLARQARLAPDSAFIVTDYKTYSFDEVLRAARQFAHRLQAQGIGKGDHVALLSGNSAQYLIAQFGISWAGAVPVLLNNALVADSLCYSLRQSDSRLIVADQEWAQSKKQHLDAELQALPQWTLPDEREFLEHLNGMPLADRVALEDAAICTILYTSGTTGLPKGVLNSHACYEAVGRDTAQILNLSHADRIMVFLPLFHTNPQMYAVMSALTVGAALIIRPRFSASRFFEDARRFGATGITFVGTVLSILTARHPEPMRDHRLRFGIGGGAPPEVWQAVHERFGFLVHELYGMTEVGGWVTSNSLNGYRFGSCGVARKATQVCILDANDKELPPGESGEIVVRPAAPDVIFSGYYNKPQETLASLRNLWFHTGDKGCIDSDGYLYFHGRFKELIRRGGEMISPVEIETKLRGMEGIDDCAAVGVPDAIMGEEIKMVVTGDASITPAAIAQYLRQFVPAYMVPRYIEFTDRIPKTETEKVQRNKLQYLSDMVHDLGGRT